MSDILEIARRNLKSLMRGLDSLDGVMMGKDDMRPFEFDESIQWNLSKNAVLVERECEVLDRALARLKSVHQIIQGEPLTEENRERFLAFAEAVEGLMDGTTKISGILFVSIEQLRKQPDRGNRKGGTNLLAVSVLKNLNPIIREAA